MKAFAVVLLLLLGGCSESQVDSSGKVKVDGLEDCVLRYFVPCNNCDRIFVIRCPNSATATSYDVMRKEGQLLMRHTIINVVVDLGPKDPV